MTNTHLRMATERSRQSVCKAYPISRNFSEFASTIPATSDEINRISLIAARLWQASAGILCDFEINW